MIFLVALRQIVFNVLKDFCQEPLLLLFLFSLEFLLGLVDLLHNHAFTVLMPIPAADLLDALDRSEFLVVDVHVVGNSKEGLHCIDDRIVG